MIDLEASGESGLHAFSANTGAEKRKRKNL